MTKRLQYSISFISIFMFCCGISKSSHAQRKWQKTFGIDVQQATLKNINSNPYNRLKSFESKKVR